MPGESTHALRVEIARLNKRVEDGDAAARILAKDVRAWSDKCDELRTERDALRTALTEVNDLLMSVPPSEDWRAVVRKKVVVALFGGAGWKET